MMDLLLLINEGLRYVTSPIEKALYKNQGWSNVYPNQKKVINRKNRWTGNMYWFDDGEWMKIGVDDHYILRPLLDPLSYRVQRQNRHENTLTQEEYIRKGGRQGPFLGIKREERVTDLDVLYGLLIGWCVCLIILREAGVIKSLTPLITLTVFLLVVRHYRTKKRYTSKDSGDKQE